MYGKHRNEGRYNGRHSDSETGEDEEEDNDNEEIISPAAYVGHFPWKGDLMTVYGKVRQQTIQDWRLMAMIRILQTMIHVLQAMIQVLQAMMHNSTDVFTSSVQNRTPSSCASLSADFYVWKPHSLSCSVMGELGAGKSTV
jgi:hypothetical protein